MLNQAVPELWKPQSQRTSWRWSKIGARLFQWNADYRSQTEPVKNIKFTWLNQCHIFNSKEMKWTLGRTNNFWRWKICDLFLPTVWHTLQPTVLKRLKYCVTVNTPFSDKIHPKVKSIVWHKGNKKVQLLWHIQWVCPVICMCGRSFVSAVAF